MRPPFRVCVTGPESTGKTTLAHRLAQEFGAEVVTEAARAYAERVARPLTVSDVEPIAREQMANENAALARAGERNAPMLVLDTDLVSTVVYAREYYAHETSFLTDAALSRRSDVYLLCDVDVPWVDDGIRDQPTDRERWYALFRNELTQMQAHVVQLSGDWDARFETAVQAITSEHDARVQ